MPPKTTPTASASSQRQPQRQPQSPTTTSTPTNNTTTTTTTTTTNTPDLDPSTLCAFENAAAGHDGVLSDPSGLLVIKPCTAAEIGFYEDAVARHEELAMYMPTFMGTLRLNGNTVPQAIPTPTPTPTPTTPNPTILRGKKLNTDTSIVLENVASGFLRPNVMDVKLGSRLWDDDAPMEKRERLDKVARETTSGSLGFRVAGMRVWVGEGEDEVDPSHTHLDHATGYKTYNKLYGRSFSADNILAAFRDYLRLPPPPSSSHQQESGTSKLAPTIPRRRATHALECLDHLIADVDAIRQALEEEESRMYSASLLFVCEGDVEGYESAAESRSEQLGNRNQLVDDASDDSSTAPPKIALVRLIDFAHARWTPGEGRDENTLMGVREVERCLWGVREEVLGLLRHEVGGR
ncbi:SAICAR synthase-like protein [Saccharata proteae CBS 121410]|uniref:Kinase n=1 Tax=Saccharata proteae CBS 121410 TaxID=1314787 RepID=A0A9P4HPQ0_9PEZI|nr:SAICAR synthase-like protein [Saccharata proteae CBS 121410]